MLAVLARSWGLCWRSWAALGVYVGGPWPLLGPMLTVLGGSWGLCWRSWAALRTYVGSLGASWGLSGRSWAEVVGLGRGSGPKSGPNPSGKAFLGRGSFHNVFGRRALLRFFFYRYKIYVDIRTLLDE